MQSRAQGQILTAIKECCIHRLLLKVSKLQQDFGEQKDKFDPYVSNIWGSHLHKVQGYAGTRNEYA
jgi:hypothetical protein